MQVIDAMLQIADSAFQPALIAQAKSARKLPANFRLAEDATGNSPHRLQEIFDREELTPYFPNYPLGTDLTATEQELVPALEWLQTSMARPSSKARALLSAMLSGGAVGNKAAIDRLGLGQASGFRHRLTRRLINYALTRTKK